MEAWCGKAFMAKVHESRDQTHSCTSLLEQDTGWPAMVKRSSRLAGINPKILAFLIFGILGASLLKRSVGQAIRLDHVTIPVSVVGTPVLC